MKRKVGNTPTKNTFKSRNPNTSFLAATVGRKPLGWLDHPHICMRPKGSCSELVFSDVS